MALAFMAVSFFMYWPNPEMAFLSDNSPVSWLSSAQLWAMTLLSLRHATDRSLPLPIALWLSVAMMGMSFDEQFMFHEYWKFSCISWISACHLAWVRELPIIMVALVGAVTFLILLRTIAVLRAQFLVLAALAVGLLAICVDLFAWPNVLVRWEEALEVLSESLFAGVLLGLRVQ
ncbi:MAG: hypothetical protein ABUS47_02280 [Steroidobacter sp.]